MPSGQGGTYRRHCSRHRGLSVLRSGFDCSPALFGPLLCVARDMGLAVAVAPSLRAPIASGSLHNRPCARYRCGGQRLAGRASAPAGQGFLLLAPAGRLCLLAHRRHNCSAMVEAREPGCLGPLRRGYRRRHCPAAAIAGPTRHIHTASALSQVCFHHSSTTTASSGRSARQAVRVAATAAPPAHVAEEHVLSTSRFDDAGLTMHVVRLGWRC